MGLIPYDRFREIQAFTTTISGGCSKGAFATFNLAYHVGDDSNDVFRNRQTLCKLLNIETDKLITPKQMHTDGIKKVDSSFCGCGEKNFESGVSDVDALYTYDKNIALGVFHADCVPLFIYVPKKGLVGIIHAGMEGTLKSITEKSINYIIKEENINAGDIFVHIGPAISFYHYQIDNLLKNRILLLEDYFLKGIKMINGETKLDIKLLNVMQITRTGVPATNITMTELCTYENDDLLYSYRRNKTTGRHLSVIKLKA